jgi:predicted Zn finger-like uncharacterized protein
LVVECGKCGTRFKLDASRLPDEGIRVRCSRCKHAFYLQNPAASEQETIDAIASEAAVDAAPSMPPPTRDLPPQHDPGASQSARQAADLDDFDEEDDWQFNEDPPVDEEEAPFESPQPASGHAASDAHSDDIDLDL